MDYREFNQTTPTETARRTAPRKARVCSPRTLTTCRYSPCPRLRSDPRRRRHLRVLVRRPARWTPSRATSLSLGRKGSELGPRRAAAAAPWTRPSLSSNSLDWTLKSAPGDTLSFRGHAASPRHRRSARGRVPRPAAPGAAARVSQSRRVASL